MIRSLLALFLIVPLAGCASMVSSATGRLASDLSDAILEQNDPETVEAGAPAYLLLFDGLMRDNPKSEDLLRSGAKLYGAYAGVFVKDAERAQRLTDKSRAYAERALCQHRSELCGCGQRPYDDFRAALAGLDKDDVPALFTFASAWAGWIQAHSSVWNAVADLAKVRAAMERVVALDESYERGSAHLYFGVMTSLLPPALGGKPEEGRGHFERAMAIFDGHEGESRTFDETDWSDLEKPRLIYHKSKTLAERAAWDYIHRAENKTKMEMVAVNPTNVFGPVLDNHHHTAIEWYLTIMHAEVPGVSRTQLDFVDVRDIVDLWKKL